MNNALKQFLQMLLSHILNVVKIHDVIYRCMYISMYMRRMDAKDLVNSRELGLL